MSDRKHRNRSRNRTTKDRSRYRDKTPDGDLQCQMQIILDRLNALEENSAHSLPPTSTLSVEIPTVAGTTDGSSPRTPPLPATVVRLPSRSLDHSNAELRDVSAPPAASVSRTPRERSVSAMETEKIVDAIRSINTTAQSTGKLDSGMRGPYRVVKALPHGRYELQLVAGSYGKTTQAAAEFLVLWRGEWTPETCAAYFDSADVEETESTVGTAAPVSDLHNEPQSSTSAVYVPADEPGTSEENEDVLQSGEAV